MELRQPGRTVRLTRVLTDKRAPMFANGISPVMRYLRHLLLVRKRKGDQRRPLKVAFVITSMPVGGAEVLLLNLIRRFDRTRIRPEIICLKERGPLGEVASNECPVTSGWLRSKTDLFVLPRLVRYFRQTEIDAVITVGAGDKMFWGRLCGWIAGVPAILSALHSTGWPDGVGRLNRTLTPITDGFIAVADGHAEYLVSQERFPEEKVVTIRNGVDTARFSPSCEAAKSVREELGLPSNALLVGIIAALRPEKNHEMFIRVATRVIEKIPNAYFLIVGDGPQRALIEAKIAESGLQNSVLCLGNREDTERILAALDLFLLCSQNEASPVSILEALSCCVPVIATRVGSIPEMVIPGETGGLVDVGDDVRMAEKVVDLLRNTETRRLHGESGRKRVMDLGSLEAMVEGYSDLIERKASDRLPQSVLANDERRGSVNDSRCQAISAWQHGTGSGATRDILLGAAPSAFGTPEPEEIPAGS